MNLRQLTKFPGAALCLLGLSILILIVTIFTNRGDITSATLVLVAFASFFGGLFVISFHRANPVSRETAALLPIPGTISFARICADLGIQGDARFLPMDPSFPSEVMQFNPVSAYSPVGITSDYSFYIHEHTKGVVSLPAGYFLLRHLKQKCALRMPDEEEGIFEVIREAGEDILDIADRVGARRSGDDIIVEFTQYHLFSGCMEVWKESPKCCTMAPCPVCSLMGCLLSTGLKKTVRITNITPDPETESITLVLSSDE